MAVSHHRDGHAVGDRAVGLAARRPPRHRQLLRAGRSGGDDAVLRRLGAGPARTAGKYKGTAILQDEQNRGLAFVNALDEPQRKQAILTFAKTGNNNLTEAWKDNVVLDYAGIRATELPDAQRKQLLDLIALYVGNMDDGHATVKMDGGARAPRPDVVRLDRAHRPGQRLLLPHPQPGDPDRVRSPAPVGTRHLIDPSRPTRQHIHAVVRTPNGNDYGKDLLRQHYLQHPH